MKTMARWGWILAGVAHAIYVFSLGSISSFRDPELARIVCFHLPCAWVTGLLVFALAWHGGRHLKNGDTASGDKVNAVLDMAVLFGALTLLTGIIFSKVQWGAYWQWDPRQASFLLLWLILAAGLALRSAFTDEARQMSVMSGYALAIVIPAIFLMFVYPRLPWVISFHPKAASLGWDYRAGVYGGVLVFGAAAHLLATRRAQVAALIRHAQGDSENHDDLDRGHSDGDRVVRPVALSHHDGEKPAGGL